ncbi:hypothetical protein ACJJTC_008430 [Scirpophaga incertulas]
MLQFKTENSYMELVKCLPRTCGSEDASGCTLRNMADFRATRPRITDFGDYMFSYLEIISAYDRYDKTFITLNIVLFYTKGQGVEDESGGALLRVRTSAGPRARAATQPPSAGLLTLATSNSKDTYADTALNIHSTYQNCKMQIYALRSSREDTPSFGYSAEFHEMQYGFEIIIQK